MLIDLSYCYIGSVKDQIISFRQRFNSIRDATVKCLESSYQSSMTVIVFFVASIIGIRVQESEVEKCFEKYEKNVVKLFKFLDFYWNFYSYNILDKLIKKLAMKERLFESVKKDMEVYKEDMNKFRESTTMENMRMQKELLAIEKIPPDTVEIFIKKDSIKTDSTLKDLEEFHKEFSRFLQINECAILLKEIGDDEYVVAWYILPTDEEEVSFGYDNAPDISEEVCLFCANEIQEFVDFKVLQMQLKEHNIPDSVVPATPEGSKPSFEATCQMLQSLGETEGGCQALYQSLRETEHQVQDHKFVANKLEFRGQTNIASVVFLFT